MQEFIARENIRRFEAQLEACSDPEQRKVLLQLLDAERQTLESILAQKRVASAADPKLRT